jgi:hypothetical protein
MDRFLRSLLSATVALSALSLSLVGGSLPAGAQTTPLWVVHVQNYAGGISAGVRAYASSDTAQTRAGSAPAAGPASSSASVVGPLHNVKMDRNTNPPLPQNETAVAVSLDNPLIAVAGSNDYVSGGVTVMYTSNGGSFWRTIRVNPQFDGNRDYCNGGDPWFAYSKRDHAFYMVQLCFFRSEVFSEVQLYKSIDNGQTWTPGRQSGLVASNFDYTAGTADPSVFHDNNQVTVDNNPSSLHYGRVYVTHVKFHLLPSGFSDYCPVQLDYTDNVPTANPRLTVFQHTNVVPDQPNGPGTGPSANQWPRPQVESNGTLDIAYALEDCNSGLDQHFELQKSSNGGASFRLHPVQIDHPREFKDNPDLGDVLAPTKFRAPASPGFSFNATTGMLGFDYQNNRVRATSGANISFEQSADGGLTWTPARYISVTSAGAAAPNDQFFPSLTALADGRWVAIWLDRRNDPANTKIETFQAISTDGVSWPNQDISTRSWDPNLGFFKSGAFIGDYIGIAASSTNIYPTWTDGRDTQFATTGIGNTDIFTNVETIP